MIEEQQQKHDTKVAAKPTVLKRPVIDEYGSMYTKPSLVYTDDAKRARIGKLESSENPKCIETVERIENIKPIRGRLLVGKFCWKTRKGPRPSGFRVEEIHVGHKLSPYTLRAANGALLENSWQFSKVYTMVTTQNQQKHIPKRGLTKIWSWPREFHFDEHKDEILPAFWEWRKAGLANEFAVRYPNGYGGRTKCKFAVFTDTHGTLHRLGYVAARKAIYIADYRFAIMNNTYFIDLLTQWRDGRDICITEVDGPSPNSKVLKDKIVDGCVEMTTEILTDLVNETEAAFGHGYTIASIMLGLVFT